MSIRKRHDLRNSGFTMIELIVAMAVFVVLTAVLLFNYNNMNQRLTLDTLSHQVAQWVRETQVAAMSVKRSRTDTGKFPGYGIHFDRGVNAFVFYADLNKNKKYDPPVSPAKCGDISTECEQVINLLRGNKVLKLCGESSLVSAEGGDCATLDHADNFDIVFTRPNPDAEISGEYVSGTRTQFGRAQITLVSPKDYQRTIEIWTTGQVSVQ